MMLVNRDGVDHPVESVGPAVAQCEGKRREGLAATGGDGERVEPWFALRLVPAGGEYAGARLGNPAFCSPKTVVEIASQVPVESGEVDLAVGTFGRLLRVHEGFGGEEVGVHQAGEEHTGGETELEGRIRFRCGVQGRHGDLWCSQELLWHPVAPGRQIILPQPRLQAGPLAAEAVQQPRVMSGDCVAEHGVQRCLQRDHGMLGPGTAVVDPAGSFAFVAVARRTAQVLLERLGKLTQVVPAACHQSKDAQLGKASEGAASKSKRSTGYPMYVATSACQGLPARQVIGMTGVGVRQERGCFSLFVVHPRPPAGVLRSPVMASCTKPVRRAGHVNARAFWMLPTRKPSAFLRASHGIRLMPLDELTIRAGDEVRRAFSTRFADLDAQYACICPISRTGDLPGPDKAVRHPLVSGLITANSGKREKFLSADHRTRTP
jgi:hypothetical protein